MKTKIKIPKGPSKLERRFLMLWNALLGPALRRETRVCMDRKFRFDFTCGTVAIEIEGGTWVIGGHSTGTGIQRDCEKGNLATLEGWKVFRLTSAMIDVQHLQEIINFVKLHS